MSEPRCAEDGNSGKIIGRCERFYDRELPLPTPDAHNGKQPGSEYSLPKQYKINHNGLGRKISSNRWKPVPSRDRQTLHQISLLEHILVWMECLSVTLKKTIGTKSGKTNGRCERFYDRELPLPTPDAHNGKQPESQYSMPNQ